MVDRKGGVNDARRLAARPLAGGARGVKGGQFLPFALKLSVFFR